jgi:hypothetical protein
MPKSEKLPRKFEIENTRAIDAFLDEFGWDVEAARRAWSEVFEEAVARLNEANALTKKALGD